MVVILGRFLLGLQEGDLVLFGRKPDGEEKWVLPSPPHLKKEPVPQGADEDLNYPTQGAQHP